MNKFNQRIDSLIENHITLADFNHLVSLQKEIAPELTLETAEDCIVFNLVKLFENHELDYQWFQFRVQFEDKQAIAA